MGLTCTGMWVKCLINQSFALCWIGQVIAAAGQPFLAVSIPKLAAMWFGPNEVRKPRPQQITYALV